MNLRTPITVITGPLGSGKTTLLRHVLDSVNRKMAIIMNEFGEIAIDSQVIEGKNVRLAELGGGCVCCSLIGEFEAAVNEIIDTVQPENIVLETTGVAEPEALVFDIEQNLPRTRLDGVIGVIDADGLLRFPSLGHTTKTQIEAADLLLLNKVDLSSPTTLASLETKLRHINEAAPIVRTRRCELDANLLFGVARERKLEPPHHIHHPEFESFTYVSAATFDPEHFESFVEELSPDIYRAKGFIQFTDGNHLFNFVNGRWDFEPFDHDGTELVFIGKPSLLGEKQIILTKLHACEITAATR